MTEPSQVDLLSRTRSLEKILPVAGKVPIVELLWHLRKLEVVARLPPSGMITAMPSDVIEALPGRYSAADAVRAIEEACGWVFDPDVGNFYVARASHTIDRPDAFGMATAPRRAPSTPRPMVAIAFRFRRISGTINEEGADFGADGTVFRASLPDGISETWRKITTRSYFEGLRDANSDSQTVVETVLQEVESGITVDALAARLPGGLFRIDGRISVSSFTGRTGTDRAVIDFPLQCDGERGKWCRVVTISGADAGATLAFRQFDFSPRAGGDAVELCVRVD